MQDLINGVKQIEKELPKWGLDIISVRINNDNEGIQASVHVFFTSFKEVVNNLGIKTCFIEEQRYKSYEKERVELSVESEGIEFLTLVSEKEYEEEFKDWINSDNEEQIRGLEPPRGITNEQWAMKQAGVNVYRDFV